MMLERLFSYRFGLPLLALAILLMLPGCDSGAPTGAETEDDLPTVEFERTSISSARDGSTLSIGVVINNPNGEAVSAEILYANDASETEASEFVFPSDAKIGDGNGYVAGSVTFPAGAEDGDVQTFDLQLAEDSGADEQLEAIFALQNLQGAQRGNNDQLILALGSITLFEEDFSDDEFDPLTVYDVASNASWEIGSFGGEPRSPYAEANGYGANEPSNDWLITPALDFSETSGQTLSFASAKNFDDGGVEQGLLVKISTDYDGESNPEDFTWTDITDRAEAYSDGDYEFVASGTLDIGDSEFQSDSVYIAFQYISSGTGGGSTELWQVDDILVRGQ